LFDIAKISILILAVLVGAGGVVGFLKAQSKASLISGIISAALLIVSYSISQRNQQQGLIMGAVICLLLCVVFGIRLAKTKKFMPAGLLLALCGVEAVFIGVVLATAQS
jgi:uncharacterized membrane protein (UPF0136 family)